MKNILNKQVAVIVTGVVILTVIIISAALLNAKTNAVQFKGVDSGKEVQGQKYLKISQEEIDKCRGLDLSKNLIGKWVFEPGEGKGISLTLSEDGKLEERLDDGTFHGSGNWKFDKETNFILLTYNQNTEAWDVFLDYYKNHNEKDFSIEKNGSSIIINTKVRKTTESGYSYRCDLYIQMGSMIYYKE